MPNNQIKPNQEKRYVSWNEVVKLVDKFCSNLKLKQFSGVYGIPRGGLCIAVLLSHKLDIPIVRYQDINEKTLIIDDICDSGDTMSKLLVFHKFNNSFVLYKRKTSIIKPTFYCEEIGEDWIVFPWEKDNTIYN